MELIEIFEDYVSERRVENIEGFSRTDETYLIRYTPEDTESEGLVAYACLTTGEEQYQIREQISYFDSLKLHFEWKIHEFDSSDSIKALLEQNAFVAGEKEVFMIYEIKNTFDSAIKEACLWEIQLIKDSGGVRDVVDVQERVWGRKFSWLPNQLIQNIERHPERLSVYCAYYQGTPIGTGWTEYSDNSKYPELHGGAVVSEWRGRGVYSDLYDRRIREAKNKGFRYLTVDASMMSRPILEKLGFQYVCKTYPMRHSYTDET